MVLSPSLWTHITKNKPIIFSNKQLQPYNILSLCLNITANVVTNTTITNMIAAANTKGTNSTTTIVNAVTHIMTMKKTSTNKPFLSTNFV